MRLPTQREVEDSADKVHSIMWRIVFFILMLMFWAYIIIGFYRYLFVNP